MRQNKKTITALLACALTGVATGVMLAPHSGHQTLEMTRARVLRAGRAVRSRSKKGEEAAEAALTER